MKYIYHILFALLLLTSCTDEHNVYEKVHRLNITFAEDKSRSTWNDKTDTDDKVVYSWENSDNMLTAIKHAGKYVKFYQDMDATATYYSKTQFQTVDAENYYIKLQTASGVKYDVVDGNYVYPVAAGDEMYCLHPINEHTNIISNEDEVYVDMELPATFKYDQLDNDLSSLADYSYVYTSTDLQSVNASDVVANASVFNSACAIIRFNITNSITSDIIITDIKMESDDGSDIFPNVLRFSDGTVAEQADKSSYYNQLTTEIGDGTDITIPRNKTGVFYNMCFPLDGNFNSVPLKFTIDTNYLTYQLKLNSDLITNNKFEAGKIYTFNFDLQEKEIHLNIIDIAQCTTYNTDETESLNIIVSPDAVWSQTDHETAQMVFVSLGMEATIDGKNYDVLWATCNLGAMEPIETGNHYAWGEIDKKESSLYSPSGYIGTASDDIRGTEHDAVKSYLGGGYWIWCIPTQQMWLDIINNCDWKWKTVKKTEGGSESEENLDFDASVWEITKKEGTKITGLIYLPITGYSGYDTTTGTYGKVNKARCHYWSSTPCSAVAGANEKSYAFETTYYTVVGSGEGHMTNPKLVESERYNGFCIRPVLLKEK